jgi:predicted FMN-binding regulatory protein PaiB
VELAELRSANYAVVEADLLDQIYRAAYRASAHGRPGLRVHPHARLVGGEPNGEGMLATIEDRFELTRQSLECDALVLATGYERELDKQMFADVLPVALTDETGELVLTENYRVRLAPEIGAGLYVQGLAEHSFGLGDTLLSLLPFRAEEIADGIRRRANSGGSPHTNIAYPPTRHLETDEEKIYAVIDRYRFATVVTAQGLDAPLVTQIPLILDRTRGERGVLFGHLDRSNPHVGVLDGRSVTALFHGPNSYIPPHVYTTDQLPTWNSVTAVVRGTARVLTNEERTVNGLCRIAELAEPEAGRSTLSPNDPRIPPLINGIVGFEIDIIEVIGRFKLSQDRNDTDRRLATRALAETARADQSAFIDYLAGFASAEAIKPGSAPSRLTDDPPGGPADGQDR